MGLSSASWPLDLAVWVGLLDGGGGGEEGLAVPLPTQVYVNSYRYTVIET